MDIVDSIITSRRENLDDISNSPARSDAYLSDITITETIVSDKIRPRFRPFP